MSQNKGILGVVLAGGQSRRMGASDKTLMPLAGTPLTKHVLDRIHPQVDDTIINTNAEAALFKAFNAKILADTVSGFAGPLAGILTALEYASVNGYSKVASVAADTPFFPEDFVQQLLAAGPHDIVLAGSGGYRQPTFGLWSTNIASALGDFLRDGEERKIMRFVQQHAWTTVAFETQGEDYPDPFFNINTPEDMAKAETYMKLNEAEHV